MSKQNSGSITLQEAHSKLLGDRSKLLHARLVEEEAFYRLRNYPKQIKDSLHHAIVTIPRKLAYIIHQKPAYISSAVEAFYLRDPIALQPLQKNSTESLVFPPEDFVNNRLKFTKVGYAQLKSQQFSTPNVWKSLTGPGDSLRDQSKADMGMRVTCGFEMLLSDPSNQDKKQVREIKLLLDDIHSGDIPLPLDSEIAEWGTEEDDDSWLNIDFRDFENELSGKGKHNMNGGTGFGDKSAQENLRKMAARFEEFLNEDSAGLDEEDLDDMDEDDDEDDSEWDEEAEDKDASFDEDEFTKMMREMMGMPPETMRELMGPVGGLEWKAEKVKREIKPEQDDKDDDEEIQHLSEAMEAELKSAGALKLDPLPELNTEDSKGKAKLKAGAAEDSSDEELLDEDFNLVKNMLESFKSQAGAAGPGGNLMGMMGMKLPRDEDDGDDNKHRGEASSQYK